LLAPWLGGLVFADYGIAFALAGTVVMIGKDIT
jgi:hypothetical protein